MKYIITLFSLLFTINLSHSQSAPVASNVSAATVKNTNASIHLVASDADFDSLTYSIVSNPSNGTISLSDDIVTYTPTTDYTGKDTFTFKANDGSLDSAIKTVTVKVIGGYKTTQTQIGTDIDGEAADDYSGASVSFNEDGTKVAIGAYGNDGNGINSGHVRVYSWNGSAWTKLGDDIDGEAAGDFSGNSVSLSSDGTTVAIGAYQNNGNGGNSGHVRVYSWSGSVWTKQGDDINGEASNDQSGYSVSLSSDGTTVAIGANKNDGNGNNAGHVRVYSWNGSAWTKLGNDIDGEALNDESGSRVSLSSDGTTVAIGAYYNDANGSDSGHVRVYSWNGSAWTKLGDDIDGEATNDYSGYSVSLSSDGTTVAIGTIYDDANGNNSGQVRVYSWSGSTWTKLGDDINGESGGDYVGYSVSLSSDGTILAIAAYSEEGNGLNVGHVKVYSWNGSTWTKLGDDIDGESAGDFFGRSVSLSSDGTTVAIGSTQHGGSSGHVRVYNLVNANAPVAVTDTMTVVEDASLTSKDVIANDTDVEGDTLSLTSVTTAGTGTVAINADGVSVDYTPAANFNGTEVITYTVSDGTLTNATGTLTVTVTAVNDAPVAVANTLTVLEDAALTSTDVIANDTDIDGDTLSLTSVTTAGTGTVAINTDGVSVDYTPAANFNGTEVITYTVSDGTLTDATGTLTVTVTAVNDAPVAVTDTMTVVEDASLTSKDVIANDTDVEGDTLSLTSVTTAGTGTVAINADGVSVDYTPAANFNGTEVITYTVSDGTLTNATGTLTVTVTAVNDAPVAVANTLTVLEDAALTSTDVIANDTDIDGDTLSLTSVTTAGTGTVAINTDGVSVDYTPAANFNGTEVITYTVSDGTLTDATGTLTVTVTAVNDAPVAVTDTMTVVEDASLTSKDVIANDTDVEGDTLSLTSVTTAGTGTVAINADGVSVDYTPAANFNGTEVITYTVSDGTLTNATGTLTVTVTAVNDAPVAVANTLTVLEDAALTSTDVIANDTDIDGDTLSLTSVTTAGTGTVAINTDGVSVDYTPAANFNGTEVITYTVSDGTLTDATGTLTITVNTNNYTINVTASSSANYTLSGTDFNGAVSGNDPNLTFYVGDQITFAVNASNHPFYIKTVAGTGTGNQASNVTNNGTESGNVVWTPTEAGTYYYQCSAHAGMVGTITIASNSNLSGTINNDTTWALSGSPYTIIGNVLVSSGVTLTIQPGVVINFSDDFKILVKGNIISSGTSESLITFNGNSSEGSNQMIIFKSTNLSNSTITYNVFNGPQKAIQLADESEGNEDSTKNSGILTVTYSDFNNAGLYTKGYSTSAELKFENSTFDDLIIKGYYPRSEPITFTNCVINNSSIDSDAYNLGISIISSTIKNSNITMGCCSANFLFNGSIVYNSNISNGMGSPVNGLFKVVNSFFVSSSINLPSSHFVSEKSIFFSKNSASDMLSIGNTEISNSSFIGYDKTLSSTGIKISGRAGYNIGGNTNISYSTLLNFNSGLVFDGKNSISIANNNILSNSLYNVKNNTSSDLILENNYWGTSTESEIQNLLYDSNEDVDKGTIDYTPFSTALNTTAPISLPSNVTKSVSGSDVVLNWSANGESDIAGYKLYYGTPTGYSYITTVDLGNVTTYTVTGGDIATEYALTAYDSSLDGTDDMVDGNESWFSVSKEVKVTLSSSATSISEPTNSATLTATLDNTSSADVVVNLTYTGTATNATDYSGAASITISAGSLTGTTAITAIDDTDVELTETIIVDMGDVSGASESGTQQVTINLTDNDIPSVSSITVDITSIDENGGVAVITATLSDVQSKDVTIPLTLTGTATSNTDYSTSFSSKGASVIAGGNNTGSDLNKTYSPKGVFVDSNGNVFVAEDDNHRVTKWVPGSDEGIIVAGLSYGSGNDGLNSPYDVFVVSDTIYVSDKANNRVMKWNPNANSGTVVAGGNGSGSNLNQTYGPSGIFVDGENNLYVVEAFNHRVTKWAPDSSEGVIVAGGNGSGSDLDQLSNPQGIYVDSSKNIYVAEQGNSRISQWSPGSSEGVLVAGNGGGNALTSLSNSRDVHIDSNGNYFVSQWIPHRIVKWKPNATEGELIGGGTNSGNDVGEFNNIHGIYLDSNNNVYIADTDNHRVQKIQLAPQITIPSGATTGTITFTGIQDSNKEDDETIIITPSTSPTNATSTISDALTVTIVDENFAPVGTAQTDVAATEQTDVTITLAGTDSNDDTLTYIISTLPTNGTLSDNGTVITADDLPKTTTSADVVYVSTSDTATSDSFTFKVNDGTVDSEAATISIAITAVNDAPIATAQTDLAATEQTPVTLTLAGTDLDNDTLSYVIQTLPTNGTLSDNGIVITADDLPKTTTSADVVYISTSDTATTDSFTFKVNDGTVDSEAASVSLAITAVNDAPVATAQADVAATEQTEVTITLAGTDAESDAITYIVSTLPTNGTLSDNGTVITADDLPKTTTSADVVYISTSDTATSDSFTFKVNDGTVDSEAATVSIAITAVNDEPTKVNLSSLVIDENAAATEIGTLSTDDLDTNDTFTYELVSGEGDADNTLFTIDTDKLKNIDAFDFETKSSYSVRIKSTDSGSASIEGVFAITVNNINDIVISSEITSTYCDGSDGTGSITIVTSETNGEVTYTWTGPNGFSSTDQNLSGLESGTYELNVKDDSFEKSIELVVEKTEIFNNLSICYVTSDSEDFTKNRIFLSYQDIYNDKKYEILREGSTAGVYEKIGELNSGETSFLDTSSNSSSSSYSYKVRLLDNCDIVSSESLMHKTILLQSSLATDNSVNLSWTSYEGVSYSTYKIYRRVNNGSFEELTAISSANNSYNDTGADVTQNAYSYYVSIAVESCTTTLKTGTKENLTNNFRYSSRANETTEIKSNQKFIQDDNGDYDNDGVLNSVDICPDSPEGSTVDLNGCAIFTLPKDNNKVSVTSSTCIGNTDGSIGLSIEDASYSYSVTVTGQDDPIILGGETKTASVTGLGKGTYTVCFTVEGQDAYEQCFEVNIAEPKALSAFIDVDNDNKTTSIQLSGSSSYNVEVNGQRYDVKGDRFTTNLPSGLSIIKISTDLDCQGIIEKEVFISEDIHYYPNPTQTDVNVHVSGEDTMVQVSVFSEKGDLIYTREQQIQDFSRKTNIDLSRQITGTYIVVMDGPTVRKTFKIVKK